MAKKQFIIVAVVLLLLLTAWGVARAAVQSKAQPTTSLTPQSRLCLENCQRYLTGSSVQLQNSNAVLQKPTNVLEYK